MAKIFNCDARNSKTIFINIMFNIKWKSLHELLKKMYSYKNSRSVNTDMGIDLLRCRIKKHRD